MKTGSGLDNPLAPQGDDDEGDDMSGAAVTHKERKEKTGKATKGKEESIELCADCCSKCVSAGRSFPCAAALAVNVHCPAIHARASCCCCYTQLYYYSLSLSLSLSSHTSILAMMPCSSCQGRRLLLWCLDAPFFTLAVFIAAQL
jgi:hypothetical protein